MEFRRFNWQQVSRIGCTWANKAAIKVPVFIASKRYLQASDDAPLYYDTLMRAPHGFIVQCLERWQRSTHFVMGQTKKKNLMTASMNDQAHPHVTYESVSRH